ncbi:acyltransferase [Microbacterium sp. CFBP9034]|uniref:acyltransferase n=1 Tax=Microbacterium sp. CFBP9034 TaxID=3096540 RepID=UPI002A6A2D89|nr:acyltransferase [Microbacterium sp. CFBP9034]MDY0910381.1 acyltransferase [Microbacterium sp. CFBP9034]
MTETTRTPLITSDVRPKAWMNVAKGLAMFLVVFFHTYLFLEAEGITGFPGRAKAALESFPMPAFFLIAGLFAARAGNWSFVDLWKRRLVPILWLYVVWSLIRFAFYVIIPGTNGDLGALAATDPLSLLLLFVWPSSSYWFLYALVWFTFGVWALNRVPVWLKVSAAALLSAAVTSGWLNFHNVGWNRIAALFLFFLIGALFSRQIHAFIANARPWQLGAIATVYLAGAALFVLLPAVRSVPFAATVMQVLAVAGGFIACKYLARVRPVEGVLSTIGEWSLQIYLIHLFLIGTMALIIGLLLPPVDGALGMLITAGCAVAVTYLSIVLSKLTTKVRWLYVPPMRKRSATRSRAASN